MKHAEFVRIYQPEIEKRWKNRFGAQPPKNVLSRIWKRFKHAFQVDTTANPDRLVGETEYTEVRKIEKREQRRQLAIDKKAIHHQRLEYRDPIPKNIRTSRTYGKDGLVHETFSLPNRIITRIRQKYPKNNHFSLPPVVSLKVIDHDQ